MMVRLYLLSLFLLISLANSEASLARGVYQHPDAFLAETFADKVPKAQFIWFTGEVGKTVKSILSHKPASLRTRYWLQDERSVWILEEIGKDKPITVGFIINQGQIERIKVLIFRESRGWEIKRNGFTDQFKDITLEKENRLSKRIDSISGATLSVNAVTKLSRVALYLHSQVLKKDGT